MGEGQQTVLPFSIHPNGGVYEFVEGFSIDDIEITYMPEWMEKLMIKNPGQPKKDAVIGQIDTEPNQRSQHTPPESSSTLESVCSRCPKLQELLIKQKTTGLHEDLWFVVMCLLVNSGHINVAREFSRQSSKHNTRSDQRIDQLLISDKKGSPRCTTLGCTENEIKLCFKKLFKNASGDITNSPRRHIRNSRMENEKIGFLYDDNGKFVFINGNVFARHLLSNFNVVTNNGILFYLYENNYWQEISAHKLKRVFRRFFDSYEPDKWSSNVQGEYWSNFNLEAKDTSELEKSTDYINVQNGLLNLDTMQLQKHDSNIFTTVQLPIDFDPTATSPTFEYYINDVFEGNQELIRLAQEILGYCIGYSVKAQKIFLLLGEGANGKSLFCNIAIALCGERNVSSISLRNLSKQFAKAALVDKLLNVSTENELGGSALDTEDIKAISAGDLIEVERKYHDSYQTRLCVKLMYAVNRMPYSRDNTYAITRRLIILPFDRTYVECNPSKNQGQIDLTLEDRIMDELSGVLNFALEGLLCLKANNYVFSKAQKSIDALEEFKIEINPFLDFVKSCVEPGNMDSKILNEKQIEIGDFLQAFRKWCRINNHKKLLDTSLKRFLKEARIILKSLSIPFEDKKSNGNQYVYGIKLSDESKQKRVPMDYEM